MSQLEDTLQMLKVKGQRSRSQVKGQGHGVS